MDAWVNKENVDMQREYKRKVIWLTYEGILFRIQTSESRILVH